MATHSSTLSWKIPGMGEPGGLPSVGLHRVGHDWSYLAAAAAAAADIKQFILLTSHTHTHARTKSHPSSSIIEISVHRKIFHWEANYDITAATATAKSLQSCLTLCDPKDGSPPGSPVPGILQARTLEWAAISFSNAWEWKVKVKSLSRIQLLATPWTAAYQTPPSMGFSRQEYWSGVPSPSPCDITSIRL